MKAASRSRKSSQDSNAVRSEQQIDNDHKVCRRPMIMKHKKSGGLYRVVDACVNKDTDEYTILYRAWDDFGNNSESLYSRSYKSFHEKFEHYEYRQISLIPTEAQRLKNLGIKGAR